jgi:hypothetical protein
MASFPPTREGSEKDVKLAADVDYEQARSDLDRNWTPEEERRAKRKLAAYASQA